MSGDKLTSNGLRSETVRSAADHISVSLASAQESALAQVRGEAGHIIYSKWSREKQQNAALGLLDQATTDLIKSDIQSVLDVCNAAEAAITAITASDVNDITEDEKQTVRNASDITWPTI